MISGPITERTYLCRPRFPLLIPELSVAAAIIMSTLYGHDISPTNDFFVDLAEQAVGKLSEVWFPGAAAVNAMPFLRHIPAWFPGAGFKRFANEVKHITDQLQTVPLNFVREAAVCQTLFCDIENFILDLP